LNEAVNQPTETYKLNWLRKVILEGRLPEVKTLAVLEGDGEHEKYAQWNEERAIWSYREVGHRLTNATVGIPISVSFESFEGNSYPNYTDEYKAKMRAALDKPEVKKKMSDAAKRRCADPEHIYPSQYPGASEKIAAAKRGDKNPMKHSDVVEKAVATRKARGVEINKIMKAAAEKVWSNPERRKTHSDAMKKREKDPKYIGKNPFLRKDVQKKIQNKLKKRYRDQKIATRKRRLKELQAELEALSE
jgi:hypothetical protein